MIKTKVMTNKTDFTGTFNPHFNVYNLSQAVKHKSFRIDKNKKKYQDGELEEQMIFLPQYGKNVA